ncbi:MAG: RNA polymerase sigma factor [Candidatus Dormibacteria bacterium]
MSSVMIPDRCSEAHLSKLAAGAIVAGLDPETMYRDYHQAILRYVRCRVGTLEIAEDLVADVFLRAVAKAPEYRALRDTPLPWLYTIAARRIADHYRRGQAACSLDARPDLVRVDSDPADEVVLRAMVADVWLASLALPLTQRTALWLCYGEELDMGEIAVVMGKSTDAAKLLVHRARRGVRSRLESGAALEA